MLGFTDYDFIDEYMEKQKETLCNLSDNENLRAVLRNETLFSFLLGRIFHVQPCRLFKNQQRLSCIDLTWRCKMWSEHMSSWSVPQGRAYYHGSCSRKRRTRQKGHHDMSYLLQQYRLLLLHEQRKMCPWFSCLRQEKILLWLYLKRWSLLRELWWVSLSRMLRRRKKWCLDYEKMS
jgi:hypothetical protein